MPPTSSLQPPDLAPIREIALRYGTDGMNAEQQQQAVCCIFELLELIEHLHTVLGDVVAASHQAIEGIRSRP